VTAERRPQPWLIRLTHWVNVPCLVIMAASGLQILAAYPAMGPRGEPSGWYPFGGDVPPSWLRLGGWLAGGRGWHFAFAWLFVLNGLAYWLYLGFAHEWIRRYFLPWRDTKNALQTLAYYARIRKTAPAQGLYNGLQRLAYTSASLMAFLIVMSGLVLYKPVQLHWLGWFFGGYDGARATHFIVLVLFGLFTIGHVVLVLLHPRSLGEMITGGKPHA
jgi:thiosulfate reductase cytochrome b subunit